MLLPFIIFKINKISCVLWSYCFLAVQPQKRTQEGLERQMSDGIEIINFGWGREEWRR